MASPKFGYWSLVASAAVVALIGVAALVWGWRLDARLPSAGSSHLMLGGVVMIVAGAYGTRWLLERGQ